MFNKVIKGFRKVTQFFNVAAMLIFTGIFNISVFAAPTTPAPAGGMDFFTSAIDTMKTLVIALGAGLAVWGVINLLEGYGNDNPGANGQYR